MSEKLVHFTSFEMHLLIDWRMEWAGFKEWCPPGQSDWSESAPITVMYMHDASCYVVEEDEWILNALSNVLT